MTVTAMATKQGNEMVQRIVEAAARLHVEQGATREEALGFMEKSMVTLGCANEFVEADCGKVFVDASVCFRETVVEMTAALAHS